MHHGSSFVDLIEKNTVVQADLKSDKPNKSYHIFFELKQCKNRWAATVQFLLGRPRGVARSTPEGQVVPQIFPIANSSFTENPRCPMQCSYLVLFIFQPSPAGEMHVNMQQMPFALRRKKVINNAAAAAGGRIRIEEILIKQN